MSVNDVEWSEWVLFSEALATAPRVPGVYMAREGEAREIVYIGMVGERSGIPIGCGPVSPNLKRLGRVAPTTGASKRSLELIFTSRWTTTADKASAAALEDRLVRESGVML